MTQLQRSPGRLPVLASLALVASMIAAGCASGPPPVTATRDPQADIGAFRTFGWDAGQGAEANGQPTTIVDSQVRAAITDNLKRKGYELAPAGTTPDMVLRYQTGKAEVAKGSPFRIGIGVGSYGSSGGVGVGTSTSGVRNVTEGMLTLSVVDTARNAEVWNGHVSRELGSSGTPNAALIRGAVDELLASFPSRGSRPQ